MAELSIEQRDKLVAELRQVISDAEDLIKLGADASGDDALGLRKRLQQHMSEARLKLLEFQAGAADRARAAAHSADDYVHENPWRSIAMGAGLGLLLGMLIGRR
ncbi:MAG: hypothetical protein AMXMBFR66_02120 [Pseudomonadota bacterium]|nr:DUF883 domain-containing protein [Rubrivivax sp.]NLZ41047.1 DUF883 domain-containing protein [Comamonadaceae bacterium]